jgi:FixJ family two-component response regulator
MSGGFSGQRAGTGGGVGDRELPERSHTRLLQSRPGEDIPVIISTGYGETEAAQRFAGKAVAGFVHKPYKVSQLIEGLAIALDRP